MNKAEATSMHLVQILLPLRDEGGKSFAAGMYEDVRRELTERFGGVTAYARAPAEGLWKEGDGTVQGDDVVVYEVMVDELDPVWWASHREKLRQRFRQEELVIRSIPARRL
jgi:hypothetical protein